MPKWREHFCFLDEKYSRKHDRKEISKEDIKLPRQAEYYR